MLRSRRLRPLLIAVVLSLGCLPLATQPVIAAEIAEPGANCAGNIVHIVQPGETLSGLAAQYGLAEAQIVQANGLPDPNLIYYGLPLVIPTCGTPAAPVPSVVPVTSAPAPVAPAATPGRHIVQAGETVWSISVQYGVTQDDIVQANSLSNPGLIYVGQSLVIPVAGSAVAPTASAPAPVVVTTPTPAPVAVSKPTPAPPVVSVPAAVAPAAPAKAPVATGKRIEVNLTTQRMYAYDGNQLFLSSGVSTGRPGWETPPGNFAVYVKRPIQTMTGTAKGTSWVVPNVPNVMYFFGGDALHGTYWHNQFGTGARLSHGCVNLPLNVAAQLYAWTPVGTPVWVHY